VKIGRLQVKAVELNSSRTRTCPARTDAGQTGRYIEVIEESQIWAESIGGDSIELVNQIEWEVTPKPLVGDGRITETVT